MTGPPPTPPHCPVSCAPPAPGSTVRGSIFRMEKWEPGEVRRLARGHSWAPKVAQDCSPMPSGPAPAALSVSPPGTHGAGQGGRQCGGPGSGGGRGAKSALSQAFFSPPAAPPGRTPCPQLPEPRQFLFLAPGAASCLSFELGCWFPTHSPSSNGPRACPLTGRPPGPAWRQTGTGGPRRPPLPGTSLPPFALLFSAPSGAAPGPVPDTPPIHRPGAFSILPGDEAQRWLLPASPCSNFSTKHVDTEVQKSVGPAPQPRDQGRLAGPRCRDWGPPGMVAAAVKREDTPPGRPAPRGARFSAAA